MLNRESRTAISNGFVQLSRGSKKNEPHKYKVINISRGGLCFQSDEPFELNEVLSLSVTIDEEDILSANGRVCYRNPQDSDHQANYGLSFLDNFIDADYVRSHK